MANRSLIHQMEARERRGRWFPALAGLLSIALLGSTWIGLFTFLGANSTYETLDKVRAEYVPAVESLTLSLPDLSRVSRVYELGGQLLAELHDGRNSEPVPISEVPEVVKMAILAAEDKGFYEHDGVSFPAIASAALDNFRSGNTRGGSTITQQVVKKVFVGDEVTIERKIKEAFIAAELERRFDKDEILEFYMNSVYFGAGAYGVKAAAREFYGKTLAELTLEEAATIAVLVRNPTLYDPRRRPDNVLERRNDVLDTMLEEEWITTLQAERAKARPLGVIEHVEFRGEAEHVTAEVLRELLDLTNHRFDFLGTTLEQRIIAVFGCPADDTNCDGGGGLRIETTIDLGLQQAANQLLLSWMPFYPYDENLNLCTQIFPTTPIEQLSTYAEANSCAPTGALTMVDNTTGAVVVMASGLPFEQSQFDLAVQGRRNPGSSFKPFGLVAALENGLTLGNTFSGASPMILTCPTICSDDGNTWTVNNAGASTGRITLEEATSRSINTVYAQLSLKVGPEKVVDSAHRMGITSPLPAVPSIVLGTGAVSTLEMASAFSSFATNGLWAEPYLINRILDENGQVLYQHAVEHQQVIAAPIAEAVRTPLLKVPTAEGTAERASIGRPQGGKTGTHQDYRDAWYVGFVPQYTAAVWVGFERDQVPLRNVRINGTRYERVFGGSVPAPIWADFMKMVLEEVEPLEFPHVTPEELEPYLKPPTTIVPALLGLTEADAVVKATEAKLTPAIRPIPSLQPTGTIVFQSLSAGAEVEAGLPITIYVSNGQVPVGALPSVVGLSLREAYNTINRFIYSTGVWVDVYVSYVPVTDPAHHELVFNQSPAAGQAMNYKDSVYLTVGEPAPVAPPG
ncbi:MAG: transglycosylase domain-containing protein [Actinomycetota bacterium]